MFQMNKIKLKKMFIKRKIEGLVDCQSLVIASLQSQKIKMEAETEAQDSKQTIEDLKEIMM